MSTDIFHGIPYFKPYRNYPDGLTSDFVYNKENTTHKILIIEKNDYPSN